MRLSNIFLLKLFKRPILSQVNGGFRSCFESPAVISTLPQEVLKLNKMMHYWPTLSPDVVASYTLFRLKEFIQNLCEKKYIEIVVYIAK